MDINDEQLDKVALITGVSGQDGTYLTELLLEKGYHVHGTVRDVRSSKSRYLRELVERNDRSDNQRLTLHEVDLATSGEIEDLINRLRPDEIYNLAAQSHVGDSFARPYETLEVNAAGALRVLEAARDLLDQKEVRVYQASSSEIFGNVRSAAQNEESLLRPRNPYGCAKVYAYHQAVNYREVYGMYVSNGILYNHESPRRSPDYVTRKVTLAAANIKAGKQKELRLGNLETARDWGYAKEYVDAMWRMLQQAEAMDYVIATNKLHSIRDLLEAAFSYVELDWRDFVVSDPKFVRPTEVHQLRGDYSKAKQVLGWEPRVTFKELVGIMVAHDVKLVAGGRQLSE